MSRAIATMHFIREVERPRQTERQRNNTNSSSSTASTQGNTNWSIEDDPWGDGLYLPSGCEEDATEPYRAPIEKKGPVIPPVVSRPRRFRIEDCNLPMCIHCAGETTRRCSGGCRMPCCSQVCEGAGAQYHKNYCGRPNF